MDGCVDFGSKEGLWKNCASTDKLSNAKQAIHFLQSMAYAINFAGYFTKINTVKITVFADGEIFSQYFLELGCFLILFLRYLFFMSNFLLNKSSRSKKNGLLLASVALGSAATATWVALKARRAERENPPEGQFLVVDGVRLHFAERGKGPVVVLLHGNAVTLGDMEASGLVDRLAAEHRVIAFDRPGFGHSSRTRDRVWTPSAQADLIAAALQQLGVNAAFVVGHSMGTMVATALALNHPQRVRGLALLGGYYYPSARMDALLVAPVALPVVGDVLRYTATPLAARAMLGKMVKGMFSPRPVPPVFHSVLSREMMLRPVQLRAGAEDGTLMVPGALSVRKRYGELAHLPLLIVAGADDLVVDPGAQSGRLHEAMPHSTFELVPETGHMVHYGAGVHALVVQAAKAAMGPKRSPSAARAAA